MSSKLVADKQYDFSGGMSELRSRFKTEPNGLYTVQDMIPPHRGGSIGNLHGLSTLASGSIAGASNPTLIGYGNEGEFIAFYARVVNQLTYRMCTDASVGVEQNVGGVSNTFFITHHRQGRTVFINARYNNDTSQLFSLSAGGALTGITGLSPRAVISGFNGYTFLINASTSVTNANGANNRFSVQGNASSYPTLSDFDLGDPRDPVQAAHELRSTLMEFKSTETWQVNGLGPGDYASGGLADFSWNRVNRNVGCLFNNSIQQIGGNLWLLTNHGVAVFDGARYEFLTDVIDYSILPRSYNPSTGMMQAFCSSMYDPEEEIYFLFAPYFSVAGATSKRTTYMFDARTGKMFKSGVLSGSSSRDRQALSGVKLESTGAATRYRRRCIFSRYDGDGSKTELLGETSLYLGGAVIETGFKHWGNPEVPKWVKMIQLFANLEASFSSGVIASENMSVDLGAISVQSSGVATIPIPASMSGGDHFCGLKLTTNAVECKIDGIVFWGHVGEAPREETA